MTSEGILKVEIRGKYGETVVVEHYHHYSRLRTDLWVLVGLCRTYRRRNT